MICIMHWELIFFTEFQTFYSYSLALKVKKFFLVCNMVTLQCIFLFKWKGMYLTRHFSGNCYIYELSTQYCSTSEISLRACGNTIKDHKDDVHRLRQLLGKNGTSVLYTQTLPSFTIIPFCCRYTSTIYIRYTFSSNHNIHKSLSAHSFWAPDP